MKCFMKRGVLETPLLVMSTEMYRGNLAVQTSHITDYMNLNAMTKLVCALKVLCVALSSIPGRRNSAPSLTWLAAGL